MTMYHQHFELERSPFSIAPDPHFLYMSERHREALAHLEWGLSGSGGFVLLTGEVGTGKTTLCRCLLERIPEEVEVAFVINPRVTVTELLTTICEELGDAPPEAEQDSVKRLVDRINAHLLAVHGRGGRVVLVIDEAQNLAVDVLEQVRLLTNLETNERKLLQVILLGQPELAKLLEAPELRQLAQRVTARFHLLPLSAEELGALVQHRLAVAGARRNPFTADALTALHRCASGIPRIANVIADRALLGAYAEGTETVDARIVRRAAEEVLGRRDRSAPWRIAGLSLLVLAILSGLVLSVARVLPEPVGTDANVAAADAPAARTELAPEDTGAGSSEAAPAPGPVASAAGEAATEPPMTVSADVPDTGRVATIETESAPRVAEQPPGEAMPDPLASLWSEDPEATRLTAVRALLDAWYAPIPLQAGTDPCSQVDAAGLRCLVDQDSWPGLLTLDRPAVLELWRAEDDAPRHVALLASDADGVTLALDGERLRLAREVIDQDWRGRALVLWQMPPGYRRPSTRGDDDVTSAWLAERLALLDDNDTDAGALAGTLAGALAGTFDADLEARVRRFQLEAGLRPDGIVGPRTWMRLNDATDVGAPRLRTP